MFQLWINQVVGFYYQNIWKTPGVLNILVVKTNYLVSTQVKHWLKINLQQREFPIASKVSDKESFPNSVLILREFKPLTTNVPII